MRHLPEHNLWWPDFETDPQELMVYLTRKVTDCDVATEHCRTKGIAVQAGCHIGLWPRRLARSFEFVHTFEAVPELVEVAKLNLAHAPNVILHQSALGSFNGRTEFSKRAGGRGKIDVGGEFPVDVRTIDSLDLVRCDLIYLDIERGELEALWGASETIAAHSPVVALEILSGQELPISDWAKKNRYVQVAKVHNDGIFVRAQKKAK
jgi:FkbM family methyltransferase